MATKSRSRSPRVVFLGLRGGFSYDVLRSLLADGFDVVGVFVGHATPNAVPVLPLAPDSAPGELPLIVSPVTPNIITLAWQVGIPVWQVHESTAPAFAEQVAALQPDFLCVACFDQRLPDHVLAIPRWAALNVHPSLLPRHRGPAPIFWTFRSNERTAGVSIHVLTPQLDAGPLVAQRAVAIVEGQRAEVVERRCARVGGRLLGHVLRMWHVLTPISQCETIATYEPWPGPEHFHVPRSWNVAHAFFFMRGVAGWGYPFTIETPQGMMNAYDALGYQMAHTDSSFPLAGVHVIPFEDGLLFVEQRDSTSVPFG